MANARKRKARKARRAVNRGDRVKATPETLAKLRPHPLEVLLARGRDAGGIDADQLQCAEEIVDACAAVTGQLGMSCLDWVRVTTYGKPGEMSPRQERLSVIWFAWAVELRRCLGLRPFAIVELIAAERPVYGDGIQRLGRALDLWAKVRQDTARAAREV
jgi:hypothetical protein